MRDKIIKILKDNYVYSNMADQILDLIKENYIPLEYYKQQLDKLLITDGNSCEMCEVAYTKIDKATPCESYLKGKGWKPPEDIPDCEICLEKNEEAMRAKGWLHKDDPIDGAITVNDLLTMWKDGNIQFRVRTEI